MQRSLGDDHNSAADALIKAAAGVTEATLKIQKTVPSIMDNKLGSTLANTQAARKAIAKIAEPVLKRISEATDYANTAIGMLTEKSNPTQPADVMGALLHQEVRSALLRMTDAERRKAIAIAISSGDETFLAAATSGSPTLSGMTSAEQASAREQWRAKRHPDTVVRIARLQAGLAQMERLAPMFQKWTDQLLEEPNAAALAAAENSAKEAARAAS